jgi:4-phospho-D-threonate 3-dehydrogenase / 4-phospho-D-erythronate 3-dehydrogenase
MKIGITLGDPAGIGPEITAKSLRSFPYDQLYLIGNKANFSKVLSLLGNPQDPLPGNCEIIDISGDPVEFGQKQRAAGEIALKSIEKAVDMAESREVEAIVTAPINKEAILLAGSKYVDHETMLAALTGAKQSSTVFEVDRLRVVFMSPKHVALIDAIKHVTEDNVFNSILLAENCLKLLGSSSEKIAVAALNPHGGEGGVLGREEIDAIEPAIKRASQRVRHVEGPYPADSIFHRASEGEFDIVLSLYHDQGHIAAKMKDFDRTVSLTLGLPFLRTSVDHGTAFDIAGKNKAEATGMIEAIKKAKQYGSIYRQNYSNIYGSNLSSIPRKMASEP